MDKLKKYIHDKVAHIVRQELAKGKGQNSIAGATIHPSAIINASVIHGNVIIAEGVMIDKCTIAGNNISIGRYTSINGPNTAFYSEVNSIKVGNFCSIARNVDVQEWNHPIDKLSTCLIENKLFGTNIRNEMESKGGIEIGHDVWIGAQTVVLSGAQIGNGAIIGANAVVAGKIPPYAIAVGNPAKVIKYRFNADAIVKIEELEWWNWDIEKIEKNKNLFLGQLDVEKLNNLTREF